jgi:hypothetical protein
MSHQFVPEEIHRGHPTVEEETDPDIQEVPKPNYQLFREALDHFRQITLEDAETTPFIPPDAETDSLVQIQTSISSITSKLAELEPQLDKLVKKTNKIARQTSDVAEFSDRLTTVDAKFTRKINCLDKRVKKVISYGNAFDQMKNQVNELVTQTSSVYSQFSIMPWVGYAFCLFLIILAAIMTDNGLLNPLVLQSIFFAMLWTIPAFILVLLVIGVCMGCVSGNAR